ncbi:MAG: hypothetical protein MK165_00020 [Pirellulaceae bacterium]|nr:hypothetical protein [Pirellulaceae bacterium]
MTSTDITKTSDWPSNESSRRSTERFVLTALEGLGFRLQTDDHHIFKAHAPEETRETLNGATMIRFTFDNFSAPDVTPAGIEIMRPGSRMFNWLLSQLKGKNLVAHCTPEDNPASLSEFSERLFKCYQIDGGKVHLLGCTLENKPFLELTYLIHPKHGNANADVIHVTITPDGKRIDNDQAKILHSRRLAPFPGKSPNLRGTDVANWRQLGASLTELSNDTQTAELIATTIIWCTYAAGKLSFSIGSAAAELPFEGWARMLVDGTSQPPMFTCPETEKSSYHVAAIDDGRITVADAIGTCSKTNRRVLTMDLRTCAITKVQAMKTYFLTCPISEQVILKSAMANCQTCHEMVSPEILTDGTCHACRNLRSVSRDDPRMARILGEYPRLDRWGGWKLVETTNVYICVAKSFWKRLLIVVHRETMEVRFVATGGKLFSKWTEASQLEKSELLGSLRSG